MEKINQTLKRLSSQGDFQRRYDKMRRETLENPDIEEFILKNEQAITKEIIDISLGKLFEYTNQSKDCEKCESLDICINMMKGYRPELVLTRNFIDVRYERCHRKVMYDEKKKK